MGSGSVMGSKNEIHSFTAVDEGNRTRPNLISEIHMDAHTKGLDAPSLTAFVDLRTIRISLNANSPTSIQSPHARKLKLRALRTEVS